VIITYICSNRLEDKIRVQLRVRNFADAINRTGLHLAHVIDLDSFIKNTPEAHKICVRSDVLIIYRYLHGPILKAIQYWKAREKRIVVDFDQAINHLTPDMPDYSFWLEGAPLTSNSGIDFPEKPIDPIPLEQFKWGLGTVDAATVASARLADDWSQFTNIYELPDYLNTCHYPVSDRAHEDEIWIGISHTTQYVSFKNSGLSTALEYICQEYPQVRLIIHDHENFANEDLDVDPTQTILYSPHFFGEWVNLLLKLDLGLAPVYGNYDLRLSPINLLEFMIVKIPWVATKQLAPHDLSRYGHWVQNSPEAWKSAILRAIEHLAVYQKKASGEPFLFALGQDVSANIDKAIQVYSAILNR
jgi:hypothetical protein